MSLPELRLKKREDRRLRAGHAWIFSNEVDTAASPLKNIEPGSYASIVSADGKPLGTAYVNPNSLICARLVNRKTNKPLNADSLKDRLHHALQLRARLYPTPHYRLVYGESDRLPGLVLDRYGDVVVGQITTAGMEQLKPELTDLILSDRDLNGLLWRNDTPMREMEGLPQYSEQHGTIPDELQVEESGLSFRVPVSEGQKTGWFFDQRPNRERLARYVKGARVLDVFSYVGAWGLSAAHFGASQVTCVDSSAKALDWLKQNAGRNKLADRVNVLQGDALATLRSLKEAGEHFDVVIIDPPALIKRKKDAKEGRGAYERLNQAAMQLLGGDGILVSCSCSYHLSADELRDTVLRSSRKVARFAAILEAGGQGPDHPVHPAIPETSYLKALFCRALAG